MSEKMTADEALQLLAWAEEDRDKYRAEVERWKGDALTKLSQLLAVEAKVERLRGALERIAAWPEDIDAVPDSEDYRYWAGGSGQAAIARAALTVEKE